MSLNTPPRCTPTSHDLDVIGRDPDLIEAAQHMCSSCPILDACRADAARYKPIGVIQAGTIYPNITTAAKVRRAIERPTHCLGCKQPMRANNASLANHPDTVRHSGRGLCDSCFKRSTGTPIRTKPPARCIDCQRTMRSKGRAKADHEGTVQHASLGRCQGCHDRRKRGAPTYSTDPAFIQQVIDTGQGYLRLPPEERRHVIADRHRAGWSNAQIAAHYGIGSSGVTRMLRSIARRENDQEAAA